MLRSKNKNNNLGQIRATNLGTFVDSNTHRDKEDTMDLTWYKRFPIDRARSIEET